jgi:hypothetical protein
MTLKDLIPQTTGQVCFLAMLLQTFLLSTEALMVCHDTYAQCLEGTRTLCRATLPLVEHSRTLSRNWRPLQNW